MAFRIGLKLHEYNEMTPYELNVQIEEWNKRQEAEHKERVSLAYLTAYWHRVRKMPTLKKILGGEQKQKKIQTPEEMLEMVRALNKALGGKEIGGKEPNTDGLESSK